MKLSLYELEGDISDFKELVYNPVTRNPQNKLQKGIIGGKTKDSASWDGHDGHLHIGVNNKQVMMDLINQAKKMGIKSTENPYAKDDPNNKVDKVHSSTSTHYQNFPGEPQVGKGVDFNADEDEVGKLRGFIEWIRKNYDKSTNIQFDNEDEFDEVEPEKSPENDEVNQGDIDAVNIGSGYENKDSMNEEVNRIKDLIKKIL
jgi:hypothetical protein